MVGVKGKSGRHKKDCSCERCSKKKELKKEVENIIKRIQKELKSKPIDIIGKIEKE